MRNLQSKVPEHLWPEVRLRAKAAYEAPSPQMARALREDFVTQYAKELPSAVKCFLDDFEACIAHLRFPVAHRKVIRTTNLLERLFQEERRRMKIIPNAFGERPVLKLMYAALIRTSDSWRGIRVTAFESKQCEAIRTELDAEHSRRHASPVTPSRTKREGGSSARISSRSRT
jgi:putative transposase